VTYKPDISDQRESPAVEVAELLREADVEVAYHDWYVPEWSLDVPLTGVADPYLAAREHDVTVLLQHHSRYDLEKLAEHAGVLFDTRGVAHGPRVVRL
jgi:UDP-N-acetyl-D-glucosamine dehydrogenase